MNVNQIQVSNLFNQVDNMHKLFVYEIINFDNNNEAIIQEQTNNFLTIKFLKKIKGAYITTSLSPQLKVLNEITNSVGLKSSTDYVFISNDDLSFLEQSEKTYVFTINEEFNQSKQNVYFLGDNCIKSFSHLDADDLSDLKYDVSNLTNLWSLSLQPLSKLQVGKNANIKFLLSDFYPNIENINYISYEVPSNCLIQTIQVIGDLKNKKTGEIIRNNVIQLKLDQNVGIIPLIINFLNLNKNALVYFKNFDLNYQMQFNVAKEIYFFEYTQQTNNTNDVLIKIFQLLTDDGILDEKTKELINLFRNIVSLSWAFSTNFNSFDKNNKDFQNYFQITYQNLTPLEYITNIINAYLNKYPDMSNTIQFKTFKSLLLASSESLISPYSWGGGGKQEYKDALWFYLDTKMYGDYSNLNNLGFKSNGELDSSKLPVIDLKLNSNFFEFINVDKTNKTFILKNENRTFDKIQKNNKSNSLIQYPFLTNKITELINEKPIYMYEENNEGYKYLVNWFFSNNETATNFMNGFFNKKTSITKNITIKKIISEDLSEQEFVQKYLPAGATLIEDSINNFKKISVNLNDGWEDCSKTYYGNNPISGGCSRGFNWDEGPDENNNRYCKLVTYKPNYGGRTCSNEIQYVYDEPPDSSKWNKVKPRIPINPRPGYSYSVNFSYKINFYENDNKYVLNSNDLNIIKNRLNENKILLNFYLSNELDKEFEIYRIREDNIFSIFSSPTKTIINYNDNQNLYFPIENSFQELDNTITLTKNRYF